MKCENRDRVLKAGNRGGEYCMCRGCCSTSNTRKFLKTLHNRRFRKAKKQEMKKYLLSEYYNV